MCNNVSCTVSCSLRVLLLNKASYGYYSLANGVSNSHHPRQQSLLLRISVRYKFSRRVMYWLNKNTATSARHSANLQGIIFFQSPLHATKRGSGNIPTNRCICTRLDSGNCGRQCWQQQYGKIRLLAASITLATKHMPNTTNS